MKIFKARKVNKHSPEAEKILTVAIKFFDVFYNNQICNLIYMQDLSQFEEKKS